MHEWDDGPIAYFPIYYNNYASFASIGTNNSDYDLNVADNINKEAKYVVNS